MASSNIDSVLEITFIYFNNQISKNTVTNTFENLIRQSK